MNSVIAIKDSTPEAKAPHLAMRELSSFFFMDILRAYACFIIVLYHAHSISKRMPFPDGSIIAGAPLWWHSTIDLFFVMSGFLMVHMSRRLYGAMSGIKVFAAKRAARTPPLYWLYSILVGAMFLYIGGTTTGADHVSAERAIKTLFFIPMKDGPIIPIGWTLNYEVFFYILFATTIPLAFPRGPLVLCGYLISLTVIGQMAHFESFALSFWTDPILIDFVWGLLLAVAYHKGVHFSLPVRIVMALLAILPLYVVTENFEPGDIVRPMTYGLSAALLVAAATLRNKEYSLGKPGQFIAGLGHAAYSLYLTHVITLKAVELVYKRTGLAESFGPVVYIAVSFIISVAVGYVAYIILEKPLTNYLRSKIAGS